MAELLILGSGTGAPSPKRGAPGYLLNIDGVRILMDSGPGTLQRLINHKITYNDLGSILYTHFHPDHTIDFPAILFAAKNPRAPRTKDLRIVGPKGTEDFYYKVLALYGSAITSKAYKLVFEEMNNNDDLDIGPCKVVTKRVNHTENSIAFRIEIKGGATLVYSGDTDYCDNIISLSKGADLLILECSAPDEFKVGGHITPSLAGEIASRANCKKLILSHLYPICDRYPVVKQCRKKYSGDLILAKDNMKLKF